MIRVVLSAPQFQLINAIACVFDIIQETVFRHERRGIADSSDNFSILNGLAHNRHYFIGNGRYPTEAADQHECRIIIGHRVKRIIGHDPKAADRLDRIQSGSHKFIDVFRIFFQGKFIGGYCLRKVNHFVLCKVGKQDVEDFVTHRLFCFI